MQQTESEQEDQIEENELIGILPVDTPKIKKQNNQNILITTFSNNSKTGHQVIIQGLVDEILEDKDLNCGIEDSLNNAQTCLAIDIARAENKVLDMKEIWELKDQQNQVLNIQNNNDNTSHNQQNQEQKKQQQLQ